MSLSCSVALRLYSDGVSPDAMTESIGLEPTDVQVAGEKRISWRDDTPKNRWSTNMWGYHPDYNPSMTLEEQMTLLLAELAPRKEQIQRLAGEATAVFWCTSTSSQLETTTELSPKILAEMASYGASFSLSHYLSSDDDDTDG